MGAIAIIVLTLGAALAPAGRAHELDPHEPPADEPAEPEPGAPDGHRTRIRLGRRGFTPRVGGAALALLSGRTAEDALRLVPGLVVVQHGNEGKGHQLYLRGFDCLHGSDFEVRLDGVRLNEASNVHATGYFDLALLPVSLVHDVAVDKGPFSLEQGLFATAGSARYTLGVDPAERGVRIGYELGSTWRNRLSLRWAPHEPNDESFAGGDVVLDEGYGAQRGFRRLALAARLAPVAHGPDRFSALIALGLARFELPGLPADADVASGFVDFHGSYDDLGRGASDRLIAILRHVHEHEVVRVATSFHAGARGLDLREGFTGDLYDPVAGDARRQVERRGHTGIASELELRLAEALALEGALGLRWDSLAQHEDHVDRAGRFVARSRTLEAEILESWLAVGLTFRHAGWSARAGVSTLVVDHRVGGGDYLFAAPLPKLDLQYQHAALTLRAAYARGARPPEARASLPAQTGREPGGLPALTLVDAFELGTRLRVDGFEATLVGFATLVDRESVFDHASGQSLELDGSRRLGVELGLAFALLDALSFRLDATLVDARYDRSAHPVPGVSRVILSGQATFQHGAWRAMVKALGLGPRPLAHGATGAGYFDLSLGADFTLGRWRFGLALDNALDLEQREGVYHFASHWDPSTPPSVVPRLAFAAGSPFVARISVELSL